MHLVTVPSAATTTVTRADLSHGSDPSFAGLQTPKLFVILLSTSESNLCGNQNFTARSC